jgi:kynurenine aminotransferase
MLQQHKSAPEAIALSFQQANTNNFFEHTRKEMLGKIKRFTAVFDDLGIPYTHPEGGYFVVTNLTKLNIPNSYFFPASIPSRPRDFKPYYFLTQEIGVTAIPPSGAFTSPNMLTIRS